jgi:hypothetical protein
MMEAAIYWLTVQRKRLLFFPGTDISGSKKWFATAPFV